MEYPNGIYLYGKLNKEITVKEYEGFTTDTSTTSVIDSTIKVDVIKVPNKLTIKEAEDLFQIFDGSKEVVVDLTPYAKEVQLLDSVELVSTSSDQNKLIFRDKSGNEITSVDISGFTQIQADWNQEDTTSEAYIKNKPTKLSQFENDGDGTSPFATEAYVEENGGKIDSISLNDVNLPIDSNKNVNIKAVEPLDGTYLVYTENGTNQTTGVAYTSSKDPDTIPIRDSDGNIEVGAITDTSSSDLAANKGYVDSQNNKKLDKTGGTIEGTLNVKENLNVTGNLNVSGTATAVRTQSLLVIDNVIATNADKQELTTLLSGLALNKNANETYGLMYDPADNTVKFGPGTLSDTGVFTFNAGEGNPIAIRDDSSKFNDNHFIKWDEDTNKFTDSGFLAEDFVDVATQQTISGIKTFTDETHFGTTHFSKDLNVDDASIKIFDTTKDLVTQYKADSITIDNGTNPAAVQYVLNIPKESGTLLVNKFQYSKFDTSNDGDSWNLTDSNKNLELKYQDDNSHSSISLEKDYIELFDVNGTGTAKVNLSSNIITLDSESTEGQHKLVRITPDKVTIGNSTDAALIEIDSNSTKFNNRPQVKDNGNYVNIALSTDLNNYVATQSESADNYYAQLTNENGIISARIFQNGNETDTQNLIIDKDGARILNNKVATENQLTSKVDKLAESLRSQAYVKDSNGDNTGLSYTYTDEGGTLAVRNASGQLQVSTPLNDKDAANKEFVENSKYVVGNGLNLTEATNTLNANIVKIQDFNANEFTPDTNGVVTIPNGSRTNFGLLKSDFANGIQSPNGVLSIWPANKEDINKRTNSFSGTLYPDGPMRPIVYNAINYAVKAALTDDKRIGTETTDPTTFTDIEKDRACEILGASRKTYIHKVSICVHDSAPPMEIWVYSKSATLFTQISDIPDGCYTMTNFGDEYFGLLAFYSGKVSRIWNLENTLKCEAYITPSETSYIFRGDTLVE